MTRTLLVSGMLALFACPAWAANVYIDPTCANDGDGTTTACAGAPAGVGAFNTWSGRTFAAGNSYLQKRGTTYTGMLQMTTGGSGPAEANRVFVGAYSTGDRPQINGTGEQFAVRLDGTIGYITISDLEIYGVDAVVGNRFNMRLCNIQCTDIRLNNLVIHDPVDPPSPFEADGIWGECFNCTFDNLTIYNIPSDGIWLGNVGNFTLTNSHIYNVATSGRGTGDGVQLENTGISITILNNIIDHSSVAAKQAFNDSLTTSTHGIVSGNTFYMSNNQAESQSKNILFTTSNLIISSNRIVGGWRCLNPQRNAIIYGNVITDCYDIGFIAEGVTQDVVQYFINNTVDGLNDQVVKANRCSYVRNFAGATKVYFYNNIFSNCVTGVTGETSTSTPNANNLFYNNTTNGAGTFSVHGSSILANPLYINMAIDGDFRTQGTSPSRRAGVSGQPCIDVRGRACYPDRPDIGAYQSTSGDPAATRAVRN